MAMFTFWFGSAPFLSRISATSVYPIAAAKCKGVLLCSSKHLENKSFENQLSKKIWQFLNLKEMDCRALKIKI